MDHQGGRFSRREAMLESIVPGTWVRHPTEPDWGLGQVQSVIDDRITVNFENRGKVLIRAAVVTLHVVDGEDDRR